MKFIKIAPLFIYHVPKSEDMACLTTAKYLDLSKCALWDGRSMRIKENCVEGIHEVMDMPSLEGGGIFPLEYLMANGVPDVWIEPVVIPLDECYDPDTLKPLLDPD